MWKKFLYIILVTLHMASKGDAQCPSGEVLDRCPFNCTDSCPMKDEFQYCRRPNRNNCTKPKCVCEFNYRRAQNGTCIPKSDCPPFECSKPNEEYNSCPPYCPNDDCSEATLNGECLLFLLQNIQFVVLCQPACRCKPTFWRKNGVCVPYQKCF